MADREDIIFEQYDRNADGIIDAAERELVSSERFDKLDLNSDDSITEDEFNLDSPQPEPRDRTGSDSDYAFVQFADVDTDNNGSISREEWQEIGSSPTLDRLDANGDGIVTRDEASDAISARRQKLRERVRQRRN